MKYRILSRLFQPKLIEKGRIRTSFFAALIISSIFTCNVVQADYTLSELEMRASQSHPAIQAATAQIQALQGKRVQAGLLPNPVFNYTGAEIGNEGAAGFQGGTISQEIVTAGKLEKDQCVVDQEILAARYNLSVEQLMVAKQIRQAAFEVMAARRIVAVNEQINNITSQTLENSESLYKNGQIDLTDIYLVRIEAKNANLELENSKTRYWSSWRRLASAVGEVDLPAATLEDLLDRPISDYQWDAIQAKIDNSAPELAKAQTKYLQASAQLQAEIARKTPNIEIEAGMQYDCSSRYNTGLVTVSVPIPFFNKNQGNIAQAQAGIGQAVAEGHAVSLDIRQRLAAAFADYQTAQRQLEWFNTNIKPDLQETLNATLNGYKQGEVSTLQLQAVQKNYFQQIRSIIEIKSRLNCAAAEIDSFFIN